jgi:hypothetical protein
MGKESAGQLREICDTVTKNLRALEVLEQPIQHWDAVIIFLVTSKLDKQTARDWESYKKAGELSTLDELQTFLCQKADTLNNLQNTISDSRIQKTNKSFFASNISCYLCNGSHPIYNCDQFLPIKERIKKVKGLKLCSNCLRNSYADKNCQSRAKNAKKNHNTLLHVNFKEQS